MRTHYWVGISRQMTEGSFDQTHAMLSRALQVNPRMPRALALQAGLRKMTASDRRLVRECRRGRRQRDCAIGRVGIALFNWEIL